jgi:hypothetical protein
MFSRSLPPAAILLLTLLSLVAGPVSLIAPAAAQQPRREYIGFVYPAGGQQGTTFSVRLGGQRLNDVHSALVTGPGVSVRFINHFWNMSNPEREILRDQLKELRKAQRQSTDGDPKPDPHAQRIIDNIEARVAAHEERPASNALAELVFLQITIAPDAPPGPREIRLVTAHGITNPLPFHVGSLPESTRKPLKTSPITVLGKEQLALRSRPIEEAVQSISLPCILNGQIAPGERNSYRFSAAKGQRVVIATAARQLIPYIADAVPGWFQPVVSIHDESGRQIAHHDDYHFKPDPVIRFDVPADGQYVLTITDALFRGREDWVYRISIGQLPFITSIFPLGSQQGASPVASTDGWNLQNLPPHLPPSDSPVGIHQVTATSADKGAALSNAVPFAIDSLPDCLEIEPNNTPDKAHLLTLPIIVNGRIDRAGDADLFAIDAKAGQPLVVEVLARRLDSPLDSIIRITDPAGRVIAFNDDHDDPAAGLNTHHADSYISTTLPADGRYFIHLADTSSKAGPEFAYRLRLSPPQPDFALRVVPSSLTFRGKNPATATVFVIRKDGFNAPIQLALRNAPEGFTSAPVTLGPSQEKTIISLRSTLAPGGGPIPLIIEGTANLGSQTLRHDATPAEDAMQAFLWRHLVPAADLLAIVDDPAYTPPNPRPMPDSQIMAAAPRPETDAQQKFTRKQVENRLVSLRRLYQSWLLTESFYARRVAECEAAMD